VILSHYNRTRHDKNIGVRRYSSGYFIHEDVNWGRW